MNLGEIKSNVTKISSSYNKEKGKKLVKENMICDLEGKKIDNIYHIYSKVLNDNKSNKYNVHIKINSKTNEIINSTCSCERFKESKKHIRNYVCNHIVGTVYFFYKKAKKNLKKKEKLEPKKIVPKEEFNLDIKIKCQINDNIKKFNCYFNEYNSNLHNINEKDLKVINYINDNKEKMKGNSLVLYEKDIRNFLKLIDKEKEVQFNYNSLNYKVFIKEENVPVSLALSLRGDKLILKHHNNFPLLLNSKGEVMFFNGNIYLPRKKQIESYIPLEKKFLKNRELIWNKSLDNLDYLLRTLKNITNEVSLDNNVKEYKKNSRKVFFYFYKRDKNIFCNIKIDYFGYIIDLAKNKNDKSFLRDIIFEKIIKMNLNKYRFSERKNDYVFIGDKNDLSFLINEGFSEFIKFGAVKSDIS